MMTHMIQASSTTTPAEHCCAWQETPIARNPPFVASEQPLVANNAWAPHPETSGSRLTAAAQRLAPSLEYMQAHLDQPITIATLSAMVGLSQSSFFDLFRKVTHHTPLNWFIRARMRRAVELLEQTRLPIKEVAHQVGYQDPLYFSRAFKSVCGIPPTEYRARTCEAANVVAA
jgi:AraC-like DNA-binding protein